MACTASLYAIVKGSKSVYSAKKKEVNYFMNRRELAVARTALVKQTGLAVGFPEIPLQNWIAASHKAQGILLFLRENGMFIERMQKRQ